MTGGRGGGRRGSRKVLDPKPTGKQRKPTVWLNVLPDDLWLRVEAGETIWKALERTAVELGSDCGGLGKCGKCKVKVLSSIGFPPASSRTGLDQDEIKEGVRLACRTSVSKDLMIQVTPGDEAAYVQVLKTGERPLFQLDPLVKKRLVTLPEGLDDEGLSDFGWVKLGIGAEVPDLRASLRCLRDLPKRLDVDRERGAAVLHESCLLGWEGWESESRSYGLVFDLGTSTLVGKLINLLDGSEVAAVSRLNSQGRVGSSVISRLGYIKESADGLGRLRQLMLRDVNGIIERLLEVSGLAGEDIYVAVAAGNTTMQHILLGVDPSGIATAPFRPVWTDGLAVDASEVGFDVHDDAVLYVMPTRSGYIGGDLVATMLASGVMEQEDEVILGLDLGTNGEIFLGNSRRLLTCSAAAGPAFEGARISDGMIARAGAIEAVWLHDEGLGYRIVGNVKPRGICGSGLVDLVAELLHLGIIDEEGLIVKPEAELPGDLGSRVVLRDGVGSFLISPAEEALRGRPLTLTQLDVRELQLAKGAIAAGIGVLLHEYGIGPEEIDRICLAGAFGNYVHPLSAMRIGLFPHFDLERVTLLGNAATTGASMALLSRRHWARAQEIADAAEHVELSTRVDFNDRFVEELDFPSRNLW